MSTEMILIWVDYEGEDQSYGDVHALAGTGAWYAEDRYDTLACVSDVISDRQLGPGPWIVTFKEAGDYAEYISHRRPDSEELDRICNGMKPWSTT